MDKPNVGDKYACQECGMEIQITKECTCEENKQKFECCGKAMAKG